MSALFDGKMSSGYAAEVKAAVAGFHSILSISLDALSLAQNPTIMFHETLHERISTRTPDGFTHLRLKHLSVTQQLLKHATGQEAGAGRSSGTPPSHMN